MELVVTFMGNTVVVQENLPSGPKVVAAGSPRAVAETMKDIFRAHLEAHLESVSGGD